MNLVGCELDESLDRPGFGHRAASIGERIGGARIGAAVYEADAGRVIWPYHYHYGTEEWLYVLAGAPVLRDPAGERALSAGHVVCFPANHLGAHTLSGPGRFVIVSADASSGPYVSIYPDSDKLSVWPGSDEAHGLNALRLPRDGAVDYWYGEADGPLDPVEVVREPPAPSLPVVNVLAEPVTLAPEFGARRLTVSVLELEPGVASAPYQYVYGREEWALVLAGEPTVRHPDGEDVLQRGDVVCFPEGPAGAHQLLNRGPHAVRALSLSTTGLPANTYYPDTNTWQLHNTPGRACRAQPVGSSRLTR